MNPKTHEQSWPKVTRRHKNKHAKAELGPPSVEGSDTGRNWTKPKPHPGLYRTRTKTLKTRLAPITQGGGHSTPAPKKTNERKRKDKSLPKQNSTKRKPSNEKVPHHLVQDLNNLSTQEFQIALDYWMNHFNFPYTAYDEPIYPDDASLPEATTRTMSQNIGIKRCSSPVRRSSSTRSTNETRLAFTTPNSTRHR
jgi:hypothetical protein